MKKVFLLLLIIISIITCSDPVFHDNVFTVDSAATYDTSGTSLLSLSFAKDSVIVDNIVIFNVFAENIFIDSTKFDLDGDGTFDKEFTNFVKVYTHAYSEVGTYNPKVVVYSQDSGYVLTAKNLLNIMPVGYNLIADTIAIDTLDSLTDGYVEDSTLSIGSPPNIAFIDGYDEMFLFSTESYSASKAVAFDEEDGELPEPTVLLDAMLYTLPQPDIFYKEAFVTYKAEDSHGNITKREQRYTIRNKVFKEDFDLSSQPDSARGFTGHLMLKDSNHYKCTKANNFAKGVSTFLLNGTFTNSSKKQMLLTYYFSRISVNFKVATCNDTLKITVKNEAHEKDTVFVPNMLFEDKPISLAFTLRADTLSIYRDAQLFTRAALNHNYEKFKTYSTNVLNTIQAGADELGENECNGTITRVALIQKQLTTEELEALR